MNTNTYQNQTTVRDYLRPLFRNKAVVIISFLTVVAAVVIGLEFKTPVYQAQVKMLISAEKQIDAPYYRDLLGARRDEITMTQSEIVKSEPVLERVVRALGLYTRPLNYERQFSTPLNAKFVDWKANRFNKKYGNLTGDQWRMLLYRKAIESIRENVSVEPIRDTNLFTISARDFSSLGAAIIANVVSRSYVIFDLEQQLVELELKYGAKHPSVKQLSDNIDKMAASLRGEPLSNTDALGPASVKIVEQAHMALKPEGVPNAVTIALGVIMGLFLGIMLAYVFDYMDQTFKSPEAIESSLNLPLLASIPRKKLKMGMFVGANGQVKGAYKESYQTLSDQMHLMLKDSDVKSIVVASVLPKEGASTIITNLATLMAAKHQQKVLVIDANLRKPSLHKTFKVTSRNKRGLADVLEGKAAFDDIKCEVSEHLTVLPAGRTRLNPVTLLDSARMKELMQWVKEHYEVVLIDCSKMRDYKDVYVLSAATDAMVLVVNEGTTRRQAAESALASFNGNRPNILGVILNHRTFPIPKMIYEMT